MSADTHHSSSQTVWLTDADACTLEHLAEVSGLSADELRELIDSGAITPVGTDAPPRFHLHTVVTVRTARRLRDDFELDRHGLAMAIVLIKRIEQLERQLQALQG